MKNTIVIFFSILIILSCRSDIKIIPEETIVEMLSDIYMADATIEQMNYRKYHYYDTVMHHSFIYDKYGYTKTDFDSSMAYYIKDLEKLKGIQDNVVEMLQKRQLTYSDSVNNNSNRTDRINIWPLKNQWKIPEDGEYESIEFEIPIKGKGKYQLLLEAKLYKDDGSENPRILMYFYKEDSINIHGKRDYFSSNYILKDQKFHHFNLQKTLEDTTYKVIKGQILAHTNIDSTSWKKHAEVKNIFLYYFPLIKKKEIETSRLKNLPHIDAIKK